MADDTTEPSRAEASTTTNEKEEEGGDGGVPAETRQEGTPSVEGSATTAPQNDTNGPSTNETMEKDIEKERQVFNSLFSTRRPKDGWAGLSSGLKSVAKGTAAGVASLVAQPMVGARNGGVGGFLTGLATGVASCVALPVTGVCVGAYQVSRGFVNSAEAVSSSSKGMVWNEDTREWYYYRLDEEFEEVQRIDEKRRKEGDGGGGNASGGTGPNRNVKDDTYYKLLGVPTNASQVQLKKAYHKLALKHHPDKGGSPDKFQELGHAYQVLANEQTRAAYDRDGLDDNAENKLHMQDVDPYVFFAVMFGSELVEPYIGSLWLASKAETFLKDSKMAQELATNMNQQEEAADDAEKQMKREEHFRQLMEEDVFAQRKRQVNCAVNLRKRIQPFVESEEGMDESEFVVVVQAEAAKICQTSFGHVFCTAIGKTLELEAIEFLGFSKNVFGNWDAHSASLQKQAASFSNNIKVINAGIAAVRAGSQAMKEVENVQKQMNEQAQKSENGGTNAESPEVNAKETMEKLEDTLPAILELAWAFNVRDINRTLRKVCHKLFYDASVDREVRWKRAEAVRILGREFFAIGKASETTKNLSSNPGDKDEIKLRAEIAAMTTLAKAQGQEITEKEAEFMIRQQRMMKQATQQQQASAPQTQAQASTGTGTTKT
mmetsp:Transcript_93026/g.268701  ORF Transcript_93026/g.268701 Transcript_93026/m.268701 type:complete len:661 (+) Transcript_93026:105-2087(+)|eukprot:CAMPEP_0176015730 /NCGR_PEP_ID=MMETSP0120_2-20121206/7488_1 /TAXON_ID=160619 /ORGANISM="Kryptoperidinium foliaceum, Strain CCMP 1326" /LENGTH=660 /DNA_ID=CAMNT_0017348709 /DNA_START=17 /DNA_END=1999 /DNA_ORIENTATION=+